MPSGQPTLIIGNSPSTRTFTCRYPNNFPPNDWCLNRKAKGCACGRAKPAFALPVASMVLTAPSPGCGRGFPVDVSGLAAGKVQPSAAGAVEAVLVRLDRHRGRGQPEPGEQHAGENVGGMMLAPVDTGRCDQGR